MKTVMSESSTVGLDEVHLFSHCSQVSNVLVLGCALAVTFNLQLTLILAVPLDKTNSMHAVQQAHLCTAAVKSFEASECVDSGSLEPLSAEHATGAHQQGLVTYLVTHTAHLKLIIKILHAHKDMNLTQGKYQNTGRTAGRRSSKIHSLHQTSLTHEQLIMT